MTKYYNKLVNKLEEVVFIFLSIIWFKIYIKHLDYKCKIIKFTIFDDWTYMVQYRARRTDLVYFKNYKEVPLKDLRIY